MKFGKSLQELPTKERRNTIHRRQNVAKAVVALGLVGGAVGLLESNSGSYPSITAELQQLKNPKVLNGDLVLKPGTILRNSFETPEQVDTDQMGGNVAAVVQKGQEIVVQDPAVITKTNGENQSTTWYAFQVPPEINHNNGNIQWAAIDGTDLSPQTNSYEVYTSNGDTPFNLAAPDTSDLLDARYGSTDSQSLELILQVPIKTKTVIMEYGLKKADSKELISDRTTHINEVVARSILTTPGETDQLVKTPGEADQLAKIIATAK
jgi:hypothetical protein